MCPAPMYWIRTGLRRTGWNGSPGPPGATFTPRVVVGIGHSIEMGVNLNGLNAPELGELDVSPTVKWRLWKAKSSGWAFLVGDDVFLPIYQRSYNVGNYAYAFFSKEWKHGTRIGFGGYDFTKNVVSAGNRAGGNSRLNR